MNYRAERGRLIHEMGGQVRRVDDSTYVVLSQTTPNVRYTLKQTARGWDCSCPDTVTYCKHAHALEARLGPKARADRALMMHRASRQVERIASDHYLVRSQSTDSTYEVRDFGHGWMCSCPDHLHTLSTCKHIQTVEFDAGARHIIERPNQTLCWFCDSPDIIRKGKRGGDGSRRFKCKACGKHFTDCIGFERMRHRLEHITVGVEVFFAGLSSRKTAAALTNAGCPVTYKTVQNWGRRFSLMMEQYLDMIKPHLGETWRTDELYLKIRGDRKYLFAMLDAETRYWIARQVATHKGTDDVRPMFVHAKRVAGKVPSLLISDGASNFAEAHKGEYAPRNFLWKASRHEPHVRMDGDPNNNQMESFNGNTLRMREKVVRGLKSEDSAILSGLQVYHNHIRPHLALDGRTPGEAAGIHVNGANPWLAIVESAAKFAARLAANPPG